MKSTTQTQPKNAEPTLTELKIKTEWNNSKKLTPKDFTQTMKQPVLINIRRIYNPEKFKTEIV